MVERLEVDLVDAPRGGVIGKMKPEPNGRYVSHYDYQQLESKLSEALILLGHLDLWVGTEPELDRLIHRAQELRNGEIPESRPLELELIATRTDLVDERARVLSLECRLDSALSKLSEFRQIAREAKHTKAQLDSALARLDASEGMDGEGPVDAIDRLECRLHTGAYVMAKAVRYIQMYHREYGGLETAGDGLVLLSEMQNFIGDDVAEQQAKTSGTAPDGESDGSAKAAPYTHYRCALCGAAAGEPCKPTCPIVAEKAAVP